ncbi:MAG: hypothetical protein PHQ40_02205 [Anaerolineaceae bacterium]|nr:hypothetical protein [Anaerolineaceae bacterium]
MQDDLRFPISHMGLPNGAEQIRIPVHSVLPANDSLDTRRDGGAGLKRLAPHDLVQRYLNLCHEALWGFVTDGLRLRLMRDYHHTYTRGYVEFDLQGIFAGRDFAAFRALYRLCHASRFLPMPAAQPSTPARTKKRIQPDVEDEEAEEVVEVEERPTQLTPLESFYQHALSTGVKVGDDLRDNVRTAIETLANGFLHATPGLLPRLQAGEIPVFSLYEDILKIIYRVLFLLFAEQRGMFPGRGKLYMEEYSLTALRSLAELPGGEDTHVDLWERLKATFSMVEHGVPELDIFGYDGALFSTAKTPILTPATSRDSRSNGEGDEPCLRNDALLIAIRALTTVERDHVLQRISYADLSVEEMGSVYESLLDYTPRIASLPETVEGREIAAGMFFLDPRGKERKTTGSYYTHPSLVNELIKSALIPVLEERLHAAIPDYDADHPELLTPVMRHAAEQALLKIKVIDPAAGSGAFLIAVDNTLGLRLGQVRSGDLYPPERDIRLARRDVLAHCLFAVDLNPLAVELCKLSLWINAVVEDQKLNFLDHHIRCGNSLVGAWQHLVAKGIPSEAYGGATGDDKDLARAMKRQNDAELAGQLNVLRVIEIDDSDDFRLWIELEQLAQDDPAQAEQRYQALQAKSGDSAKRLAFDLWTAAFFWPLPAEEQVRDARAGIQSRRGERKMPLPPTTQDVYQTLAAPRLVNEKKKSLARSLRDEHRFLHWELEFPELFDNEGSGGFDVVLGNPPWEKYSILEIEYFSGKDELIANNKKKFTRDNEIQKLKTRNPSLYNQWLHDYTQAEFLTKFVKNSARFVHSSDGEINTYLPFTELASQLINFQGRAGIVVKSSFFSADNALCLFNYLFDNTQITSLYDFKNWKGLFPSVGYHERYSLLTIASRTIDTTKTQQFAFYCATVDDLSDSDRIFNFEKSDIQILSPNSGKVPLISSKTDYHILKKTYSLLKVLVDETRGSNPWSISYSTLFHASGDSGIFKSKEELEALGFVADDDNKYKSGDLEYVPFYEGKYIQIYDHRFSSFEGINIAIRFGKKPETHHPDLEQKIDPNYIIEPRYWIPSSLAKERFAYLGLPKIYIAFRRITNVISNARTVIAAFVPGYPANDALVALRVDPLKFPRKQQATFLSVLNSIPFDFLARLRTPGMLLKGVLYELVAPNPDLLSCPELEQFIIPRVLELSCCSWDMIGLADDIWLESNDTLRMKIIEQWKKNQTDQSMTTEIRPNWVATRRADGFSYSPFRWDEDRRANIRAELDGLYANLFGLSRLEFEYILGTFPIVCRKDEAKFGEYRTKRLSLEAYDRLAGSDLIPPEVRAVQQESVIGERTFVPVANPSLVLAPKRTEPPLPLAAKTPVTELRQPVPAIHWIPSIPDPVKNINKQGSPNFRQTITVAWLLENFGNNFSIPLFEIQKYSYFLQRSNLVDLDISYREFAAGPYSPGLTYKAGGLAKKRNYWAVKGKTNVVRGRNINKALDATDIVITDTNRASQIIKRLSELTKDDLGGIATVDFAGREIFANDRVITPENIRAYFQSDWPEKIDNSWFTDENIYRAIGILGELGLFIKSVQVSSQISNAQKSEINQPSRPPSTPTPESPLAPDPGKFPPGIATNRVITSRPAAKVEPPPLPEPREVSPAQLALMDFSLSKCQACGKMIVGMDQERHTRLVHGGKDPGYKKFGK